VRIQLEVLGGPLDGHVFQFNKTVQIGREGEVGLGIDRFISRRHARLEPQPHGGVVLEDLNSTNGTFVNEERVHGRVELRNGHVFRVGKTWLEIAW